MTAHNTIPAISIIIPTHNRWASLERSLKALANQTAALQQLEVVVVADGCTDETARQLEGCKVPFTLRVISQPAQGAAAARNTGAANAKGKLLLFLDDDIEASIHLVQAHMEAHRYEKDRVVIGYVPPVLCKQKGFSRTALKGWWESMFYSMGHKGHRFSYRDLLSGNFSLPAVLSHRIGGFDPSFKCQEDYEIGVRLIGSGANFVYVSKAIGYHHENTDLKRCLQRKYEEGKAAVMFMRKYPELLYTLPLLCSFVSGFPPYYGILIKLIFRWPSLTDACAGGCRRWLNVLEWLRLRSLWQRLLDRLLAYWYLRGVAYAIENMQDLTALLKRQPDNSKDKRQVEVELDLMPGIDVAESKLDALRPTSIRIFYGSHPVGYVADMQGYECLRGIHLRTILAGDLASPLLQALTLVKATERMRFHEHYMNAVEN